MPYGIIKIDTVTFTDAGVDKSVSISGLVQNPTFSGNVTVTGTLSGVTVTGTTANFTSGNFTNISGGTHTITSGVFAAGSAASPSITFTGDLNTGIYSPGADQVAISTGGSGRLFVASDGKIGIGSSGSGTQSARTFIEGSGACPLEIDATAGSGGYLTLSNSGSAKAFFGFGSNIGTASVNDIAIRSQSGALAFQTGGANERLRITSTGLVGIGISSPAEKLHIEGSGRQTLRISNTEAGFNASPEITTVDFYGYGAAPRARIEGQDRASNVNGGWLALSTANSSNVLTQALLIDNAQRVGIGTTVANSKLSIGNAASTNDGLTITFTGDNSTLARFYADTTTGQVSIGGIGATYYPAFYAGGTERARIDSSGRLLVGTSSARSNFFGVGASGAFQLEGTSLNTSVFSLTSNQSDTNAPWLVIAKSRGTTVGSNAAVIGNDTVGSVSFQAADGTNLLEAARISAAVDGTPGANDMPGRLTFSTTADGASSPTERMRLTSTGQLRLAGAGITFNGDTATANELDDYEEGTFTATLKGSVADPTTPVTTTAVYTKIGNIVHVQINFIEANTTGASGDVAVAGLPFASSSSQRAVGSVGLFQFDLNTGTSAFSLMDAGSTVVILYASKDDLVWQSVLHSPGTSRYLHIGVTYRV